MKKIMLAELIEDFEIYPRNRVDDTHVSDLARALASGEKMPAIIADRKTKRIVDGFHRRRAYLRHFGENAEAEVEFKNYASEKEMIEDAVALNSRHGRKLDRHDQTRIVLILARHGVSTDEIALLLHIPEPMVTELNLRVLTMPGGQSMPSKRGLEFMRGQRVSKKQQEVIGSVRSAESGRLALELTRLIRAGLVDVDNEGVMNRLRDLSEALTELLAAHAA